MLFCPSNCFLQLLWVIAIIIIIIIVIIIYDCSINEDNALPFSDLACIRDVVLLFVEFFNIFL